MFYTSLHTIVTHFVGRNGYAGPYLFFDPPPQHGLYRSLGLSDCAPAHDSFQAQAIRLISSFLTSFLPTISFVFLFGRYFCVEARRHMNSPFSSAHPDAAVPNALTRHTATNVMNQNQSPITF